MTTYTVVKNATATQSAFGAVTPVTAPSQAVHITGPSNPNSPPQSLGVSLTVTGPGAVSATLVIMATNEPVLETGNKGGGNPNWFDIGCTVTATGSVSVASGTVVNAPYAHFTGYIKTIGTSTSATGIISA